MDDQSIRPPAAGKGHYEGPNLAQRANFEAFMRQQFPHFTEGEMTVNRGWLFGFWLYAQRDWTKEG